MTMIREGQTKPAYEASWDLSASVSDTDVDDLMRGAVDTHIHAFPDLRLRPSITDICKQATEVGIGAVVYKCHFSMTAGQAWLAQQYINEWAAGRGLKPVQVYGGVCLNDTVGGLNPEVVKTAIRYPHGKAVWMPTHSSAQHKKVVEGVMGGITALTGEGELKPEMKEIIEIISKAKQKVFLAVGHMSVPEMLKIADGAKAAGVDVVIDHVRQGRPTKLTMDDLQSLADKGAYIGVGQHIERFAEEETQVVKEIGAERCILTTDKGQLEAPMHAVHLRFWIRSLLARGVSKNDLEKLIKENGRKVLGIET